jgi:nitrate reductase NapE component
MPDLFAIFSSLCSALGLSGAAGLNAYIPLLTVAVMQHQKVIHLAKPYDVMGEGWVIAILAVLLAIEIVVDKVPGADHVNDVIQTAVRPTAGAILFASQHGTMSGVPPWVLALAGFLLSGGIHTGKSLARPVVNVSTAGIGAPVVSAVEDLVSTVLSIVAILLPILAVILLGVFGWMLWKLFGRFFGAGRRAQKSISVAVAAVPVGGARAALGEKEWDGGV